METIKESNIQDNYEAMRLTIGETMLNNSPSGSNPAHLKTLENTPNNENDYFNLEVKREVEPDRHGSFVHAELNVYFDFHNRTCVQYEDEEGNIWSRMEVKTTINWPSYGGRNPQVAMVFSEIVSELSKLANDLMKLNDFKIWRLVMTKEQRIERDNVHKKLSVRQRIFELVKDTARGMKVNQNKKVTLNEDNDDIEDMSFTIGTKQYDVKKVVLKTHDMTAVDLVITRVV